ncbi:MAG: S-layer homology domain-containing protein, partial [Muribaculaceae bacterium]|nr:S-layer homology domain-containing protein [Muribaculaceae bacterium]
KGMPHAYLDTGERDTWAYSNIDALSQYPGILQGVGGGYFAPGRDITRAEAATLLDRLLQYELDESVKPMLLPTDVSDKSWAYRAILRGINQLLDV